MKYHAYFNNFVLGECTFRKEGTVYLVEFEQSVPMVEDYWNEESDLTLVGLLPENIVERLSFYGITYIPTGDKKTWWFNCETNRTIHDFIKVPL